MCPKIRTYRQCAYVLTSSTRFYQLSHVSLISALVRFSVRFHTRPLVTTRWWRQNVRASTIWMNLRTHCGTSLRNKEIGFRTCWSWEMLNGVSLLVNSCFKERIGRGFYIALWPVTKNGSTTIIPSGENYGECPDMPPREWPDRIFTVPRLCSAFGGTSSV